jgi:hypothetical protein
LEIKEENLKLGIEGAARSLKKDTLPLKEHHCQLTYQQ